MSIANQHIVTNPCLDANVSLGIDEACFSIINEYDTRVALYSYPSECYLCKNILQTYLPKQKNTTLVISTKYPLHIFYEDAQLLQFCHTTYNFKEHGSYGWNISKESLCSEIYTIHEPVNSYLPIFAAFMVYILLMVSCATFKIITHVIKRKLSANNVHDDLDRLQEAETSNPIIGTNRSSTRIRSVDTFRGIAILLMIFVNNGGGKYVFFNHSAWNGLTVADLVLPWFAWIMGLSITISKRSEFRVSSSRKKIILRCLQRAFILILLGLMLNSIDSNSLKNLRFPGVLQLLAISYFVCATIETIFMKMHSQDDLLQFGRFTILRDILSNWVQWLIILVIVATHTLIMFLLPVPNCPRGYLGPGGYSHFGQFQNCTGGATGYIDRLVFGSHIYSKTQNPVYGTILPHDPEGIMNTMSIILVVYLGVHAGKILLLYYQCNARVIRWLLWSGVMGIIAGLLCNFDKESGVIPVSKKMMSLSFVLTVSCFAFLLYTILHFFVDYKQYWSGAPFIYAGLNPITLYIGHTITKGLFPWAWKLMYPTHWSVLAMNLWTTTLWGIIAYWLYWKDIIISI
ncbi:heparan-alpha-glucosaminide N-acetyltransferase-like isoform X1 [Cataglyphis hispanica]|uniref:heparan-alpha-glucosaminide N-acetyltransferase-like isoform X1 n=1 Tax=Cataglyphis hispanica TaxID=1086592 RepID=UPI0021803D41|nr:heparan-alpha-glucosaminide N-acetyltransferase-like isoform X1 [Cataglyphis hispanica]XP_050446350.1 heparan-alpha-glucosaminide N-acetyltransferase-like isoform X1 [Cataglyphis hispanica]XP_050446351.1 heparan-alpha-glucosaminide N-acetyltransferase-like isoform X1 [Cataglyphis hispanica]